VYAYASKLKDHSFIEVEVVYHEVRSAFISDEHMCCKPTVEGVFFVVADKAEYALLIAKVCVCGVVAADVAFAAGCNGCSDFIANLDGVAGCIAFYVFTESDDLACALVTENYGDKTEGVALPFVYVCTANARAFNFNEDIVVLKFGNGKFFDFYFLCICEHCNLCCFGDRCAAVLAALAVAAVAAAAFVLMLARRGVHFAYDLANNAFDIGRIECHCRFFLSYT
jgi:hypothetical protein